MRTFFAPISFQAGGKVGSFRGRPFPPEAASLGPSAWLADTDIAAWCLGFGMPSKVSWEQSEEGLGRKLEQDLTGRKATGYKTQTRYRK